MSRATLKPIVSKLRESIIKGIVGKLEKYGFGDNGELIIEKPLSEYDEQILSLIHIYLYLLLKRLGMVIFLET